MERVQIERTLEVLKHYNDLLNISKELEIRIPKEHNTMIHDLIIEIENIAELLMYLEHDLYYEYLNQWRDVTPCTKT